MENMRELNRTYRRILQLKTSPVAVRILRNHEEIPVIYKKPSNPIPSFCFGIMEALKGRSLFLGRSDVQCVMGLAALGFKKESLRSRKHKQGVQIGVFRNEEASQNYFAKGFSLPAGQTQGIALSPLEKAIMGVDVLLFKVSSEQAMWLLTANQYLTGERSDICIGTGFQGVCGDTIVYPFLQNKINMTINGVGDRFSSGLGKHELFVGIPASLIKKIAENLTEICQKPIFKGFPSPKGLQRINPGKTIPR